MKVVFVQKLTRSRYILSHTILLASSIDSQHSSATPGCSANVWQDRPHWRSADFGCGI